MAGRGKIGGRECFVILRDAALIVMLMLIGRTVLAQEEEQPSLEFLEFLGGWESRDGEWLDPIAIAEEDDAQTPNPVREEEQQAYED